MSAGDASQTLIVTTRSGVRPLGVRGAPLHSAAAQLRRVVRRRLGDGAARLLADPQLHDDGSAIDWYADASGDVRAVVDLEPARRTAILADVDRTLESIRQLGVTLGSAGSGDDAPHDTGVIGRSLQLAARRPAESFVFLVGEQPVVVCWGYEKEAAASLLPAVLPRPPIPAPKAAHVSVLSDVVPERAVPLPALRPAAGIAGSDDISEAVGTQWKAIGVNVAYDQPDPGQLTALGRQRRWTNHQAEIEATRNRILEDARQRVAKQEEE